MPFTCDRCGGTYCSEHRLPENHYCAERRWAQEKSSGKSLPIATWHVFAVLTVVLVGFGVYSIGGLTAIDNAALPESPELPSIELGSNDSGINETALELKMHNAINSERSERGLDNLSYDSELAEIADYHSNTMASEGELFHVSPSGQDYEDRYQNSDYDCQVPAGNGEYYTGGENVAKSWYKVQITNGEYYSSIQELANGIVAQWMGSAGHRENILRQEWRREGVGVEFVEEDGETAVYVTQNFC